MAIDWAKIFAGQRNAAETPVRRASDVVRPEPSPGTPSANTGEATPLRIIKPGDVGQAKYAQRMRRLLQLSAASPLDGYLSDLIAVLAVNRFELEDYWPEDLLVHGACISSGGAGASVVVLNPAGSGLLLIIETVIAARTASVGVVVFGGNIIAPPAFTSGPFFLTSRDNRSLVNSAIQYGATADATIAAGPPLGAQMDVSGINVNPGMLRGGIILKPGVWFAAMASNSEATNVSITGRLIRLPSGQ